MIYTTNILAIPLVLLLGTVDVYLFLVVARLITGHLSGERAAHVSACLQQFTDPMPLAVGKWVTGRTTRPVPSWLPWAIVITAALLLRNLLAWVVVSTFVGHA